MPKCARCNGTGKYKVFWIFKDWCDVCEGRGTHSSYGTRRLAKVAHNRDDFESVSSSWSFSTNESSSQSYRDSSSSSSWGDSNDSNESSDSSSSYSSSNDDSGSSYDSDSDSSSGNSSNDSD